MQMYLKKKITHRYIPQAMHNLQLPSWTSAVFPDRMKSSAGLVLKLLTYTPKMKRIKGGK